MKEKYVPHVWVTDDEGRGYVCTVDNDSDTKKNLDFLSEDEKATCIGVGNCSSRYSLENLNYLNFL